MLRNFVEVRIAYCALLIGEAAFIGPLYVRHATLVLR